jgi:hypothetical protein
MRDFGASDGRRSRMRTSVPPRRPEAVMSQPHYPSDLSDQEWAILEPLLSSAEKRGRPDLVSASRLQNSF